MSSDQTGKTDIDIAEQVPLSLICVRCGESFEAPDWPRLHCPHCHVLGYPDRAGTHLLPLGWECPACGSYNDGQTNFCLVCGAGLASRCLRCEAPVYRAICDHCGAHQERLLQYMSAETRRATWVPIIRAQIQAQRARMEPSHLRPLSRTPELVREWRALPGISTPEERTQTSAQQSTAPAGSLKSRPRRRIGWGVLWIVLGVTLLIASNWQAIITWLIDSEMAAWADALQAIPDRFSTLSASSPEYPYLFATALFMIALFPIFLFLIKRLVERLFP